MAAVVLKTCRKCAVTKPTTDFYARHVTCKACEKRARTCDHGIQKQKCRQCNTTNFCVHENQKHQCKQCNGGAICTHDMYRVRCVICGGSEMCKDCGASTINRRINSEFCTKCFYRRNPNLPHHVIKKKQDYIQESIVQHFGDNLKFDYFDCVIPNNHGIRRRPDIWKEYPNFIFIIEIDEAQHKAYKLEDEIKRAADMKLLANGKPIRMIRFNPDGYKLQGRRKRGMFKCKKVNNKLVLNDSVYNERMQCRIG